MSKVFFSCLIGVCLVLMSLVPAAAGRVALVNDTDVTIAPGNPIKIAVQMFAAFATVQDQYDAIQMAINDFGSIKGFTAQTSNFTDDCNTPSGESAANNIVADVQIVGVIGPLCSSASMGAAPVFNAANLVMISPTNTAPGVYTSGPKVYNRVVLIDPAFEPWDVTIGKLASVATWEASFTSTYGHAPDVFAKYSYDATLLLLTRIAQVSRLDGSSNLVINRMELAAAVRNTSNFPAVSGLISLDTSGNRLHTYYKVVKSDHFSQTSLDPSWSWLGTPSAQWSLTARPGYLRMFTQDDQLNRLMRPAPTGDFEIRAHLYFTPTENFQFGGIFIEGGDGNQLALGRAFCDTPAPACANNGIYFDHVEGNVFISPNFAMTTTLESEAYLRVESNGANFTASVSENGVEWTEVGTHTISFAPLNVGLIASNAFQSVADIPADFDFFIMESEAHALFIPLVSR
jgi:hypothetical protein